MNQELCSLWCAVDHHKAIELLVTVYQNFLRDVYSTQHIYFFVQSHRIIDRVVNGDQDHSQVIAHQSLVDEKIPVERVVDITEEIFKTSSALSLFENTTILEIEYSRLQSIIQSLLSNVNIVYKNGKGIINAQEFQIQCLLEFEKLKTKLASIKKSNNPSKSTKQMPTGAGQAP